MHTDWASGLPLEGRSHRLWRRVALPAAALLVVARSAAGWGGGGSDSLLPAMLDAAVPLAVALLMVLVARRGRPRTARFVGAWSLLAAAYLAYGSAELLGLGLGNSLESSPAAPVSLVLYLLFFPLFLLGALRLPSRPLGRHERTAMALDMSIVLLSAALLVWTLLVRPSLDRGAAQPMRVMMTVAYPAGDLAVLWALLSLVLVRRERSAAGSYGLLAGSAAAMIVTDLGYSFYLLHSAPLLHRWLDSGWMAGHVLAGLAAARQLSSPLGEPLAPIAAGDGRRQSRASLYLAYACLIVAVIVVWTHLAPISQVTAVAVLAMAGLIMARQLSWLAENDRLHETLRVAHDTLDVRVQERTAELAAANRELQDEIAVREQAERRIERQLQRLGALRSIDAAISSSLDLRLTLGIFLDNVIKELDVDAAEVLLFDSSSLTLEGACHKGRLPAARGERVALGEGPAGRAALDHRLASAAELMLEAGSSARYTRVAGAGYRTAWATPLLAKAQVNGVLEVLTREPFEADDEWLDFFTILGGQGAIAIEQMSLLERTQRAHIELIRAYESTLEGWSRALDLRHQETQGHTLRVTEGALRLAEAAGIDRDDLVHVRRGSLLHDIGKMGIPDSILLKPGPLDEAEWEIMRRHPVYAFQLLSPIPYLRPALDIPYCHHERWDGSGYPRGLKGAEIPFAARVFSVVDCWDALSSDRPYRKAWPPERVNAQLRQDAGTILDPQIVELFLEIGGVG